ncbi:MAG TPA: nucleotide pyrophosphohydrolase [Gemmatimonadales bacterium]|jgi:NTP pyrophosphatase (non-canonical NTP hydrolase)|nr:nucleotide pyrophosphohydrolase [Gemmatimonadales bacterium]
MERLLTELREFVRERDWEQFHDPKNLAMCLASEVGELLAEYRWIKNEDADQASVDLQRRERITEELGDVGIAWALLCDRLGLDPVYVVRVKLDANRLKYPTKMSRGKPDRPTGPGI